MGPAPRERFPIGEGDEEKSFDFGGRRRTYLVHVPPGFDRSRRLPLVIVLHGGVVNAYFTAYNTGMSRTADREGFIAVYPNGTGRFEDRILTWNVGFGFAYALRNNVDDVGFLRELTARMVGEYGADPSRVYATGISNGGIMSYRLASEASDLVAAVAPVAGASAGSRRPGAPLVTFAAPARPVSVIAFHGMQDRLIPYGGGPGRGLSNAAYLPVQHSIDMWVGYDGCSKTPETWTSPSGNIVRQWYGGGRDGSEVVLYTIRDGGHSWPGGVPFAADAAAGGIGGKQPGPLFLSGRVPARIVEHLGATTQEISANDLMWEFFKRHRRT
jgi:polyhydroxybutyrate depolymerase